VYPELSIIHLGLHLAFLALLSAVIIHTIGARVSNSQVIGCEDRLRNPEYKNSNLCTALRLPFVSRPEPFIRWLSSVFLTNSTVIAVSGIRIGNLYCQSTTLTTVLWLLHILGSTESRRRPNFFFFVFGARKMRFSYFWAFYFSAEKMHTFSVYFIFW